MDWATESYLIIPSGLDRINLTYQYIWCQQEIRHSRDYNVLLQLATKVAIEFNAANVIHLLDFQFSYPVNIETERQQLGKCATSSPSSNSSVSRSFAHVNGRWQVTFIRHALVEGSSKTCQLIRRLFYIGKLQSISSHGKKLFGSICQRLFVILYAGRATCGLTAVVDDILF